MDIIDFFPGADIQGTYSRYYHFVGSLSIEKWAHNGVFIGQTFTGPGGPALSEPMNGKHFG